MITAILACFLLQPQPVICIDPGHISEVGRGTRGKNVTELRVAWEVATALEKKLEGRGYRVVLTKSKVDEVVTNRRRAEIANEAAADLMVRLHCDAASGSGFAVYYPTRQGSSAGKKGPSTDVLKATAPRAKEFHAAMGAHLRGKLKDNGLKSDTHTYIGGKQGALTGSIYSEVPVVLVEMVVLTNPKDEAFIVSKTGREAMIDALAAGVEAAVPPRTLALVPDVE